MSEEKRIKFEEYLEQHGELTYTNRGVSMMPMLRQGKDLLTVRKKNPERLKKYDVALYIRPPHDYVLHRVVEVRENDYVILGDNCLNKEVGITDDQIIGRLTHFTRGKRTISVENRLYRLYAHAVVALYPIRRVRIRVLTMLKRRMKKWIQKRNSQK